MRDLTAARRYGKSLFLEAQAQNQVLACEQGLQAFIQAMKQRRAIQDLLAHPSVTADEKRQIVRSALGEYATPLLERFMEVLVRNHRVGLLETVASAFRDEVDRAQNIQPVTVESASALTDQQQAEVRARLERWTKSKVNLNVRVDPQLLGGIVIRTKDYVLDESLKGQLEQLRKQLTA